MRFLNIEARFTKMPLPSYLVIWFSRESVINSFNSTVKNVSCWQVTVVHISNEHKNAADEKLRQCMRKFCDSHKAPVTLVLISGDWYWCIGVINVNVSQFTWKVIVSQRDNVRHFILILLQKKFMSTEMEEWPIKLIKDCFCMILWIFFYIFQKNVCTFDATIRSIIHYAVEMTVYSAEAD